MNKNVDWGFRPRAALSRLSAIILPNFTARAVAAVAAPYALLFPLFYAGWLGMTGFLIISLLLSVAGVALLGRRLARSVAELRAALKTFDPRASEAVKLTVTGSTALQGLQRSIEGVLRRVALRELKHRAARALAERESANSRSLAEQLAEAQRESAKNRRLAEQLARAQRISRVGSWEWERAADHLTCSSEVYSILRVDAGQFRPRLSTILGFVHADDRRAFRRWMISLARGAKLEGLDVRMLVAGTELRHVHVLGEALRDSSGRVVGVTGTIQDATERTRAIQQIHRLAYFDVLTELPNRSRFHEKLAETLEAAKAGGTSFAIMFLDLDQFKRINDTLGHSVGDDLLRIIAQRLTRSLRPEDLAGSTHGSPAERDVCRQGGDEFIVLLNGVATEQDAARAANRLLATLAQPIVLGAQDIFVSASIGIVLYPRDGQDLDTLLKNADVAMYHAKAEGRNRYFFYQDSMRAATARQLSLEHDLRKALENEEFELYYQPQIEVPTGKIVGVEALIRWHHPTLGLLGPAHFIGVAEEAGLIMAIWEWVLVAALIQHNAWVEQGLPAMTIGVNLSSVQFSDRALAEQVQAIARVVNVPLDHLELEVTESMLLVDFDAALETLTALRAMGVKIAIDDFGTGYSSLSYLRRLPLDKLKLDQSFTRDAQQNEGDVAITRAIIAMAQSLKLAVVAEGVETQAQIDLLLSLGCTTVQGFLLGRPLPAAETAQLLRQSVKAAPDAAAVRASDARWGSIVQPRSAVAATLQTDDSVTNGSP
jgi:diguanylate cyclase (GGDEF)-like protein